MKKPFWLIIPITAVVVGFCVWVVEDIRPEASPSAVPLTIAVVPTTSTVETDNASANKDSDIEDRLANLGWSLDNGINITTSNAEHPIAATKTQTTSTK